MFGTIFTYICKNANAKVELYSPTSVLSMGGENGACPPTKSGLIHPLLS